MQAVMERVDHGRFIVRGEISFSTAGVLYRQSQKLFTSGKMLIDLSQVSRADSAGVALLIEWLRMARRQNTTVYYENVPAQILSMVQVTGLQHVLPMENQIK